MTNGHASYVLVRGPDMEQ